MSSIRQMTYQPPDRRSAAVEVMTFDRLRALNDGGTQRADFFVLGLVDTGRGSAAIDFVQHDLAPRSALWIAPGAVHQWHDISSLEGHLVLFVPTAPATPTTRELAASADLVAQWAVSDADWPYVDVARKHLVFEVTAAGANARTELPEILLSALIMRVHPPRGELRSTNPTFQQFRASVEAHFREHHDVGYYAHALGYAPRTLTRAVQRATGRTAKEYIVDRIILEAKRLLAHDRLTAARCAAQLGFPDASNFSVFFHNATGVRPGAWQQGANVG